MSAIYTRLASGAFSLLGGLLPFTIDSLPVTALHVDLAQAREALETLPVLALCLDPTPEDSRPFATGGYQRVVYALQVVVIARGNRTRPPLTGQDELLILRENARKLFQRPGALAAQVAGAQVLQISTRMGAPIARAQWLSGYHVSAFTILPVVIEQT
jgi:hypothetical protein